MLFFVRLAAQIIPSTRKMRLVVVTGALFIAYFNPLGILPFGLSIFPTALVFFLVGSIVSSAQKSSVLFDSVNPRIYWLLLFLGLLVTNLITSIYNARISVYGCYYGYYPIAIISGISGIAWLYMLCIKLYDTGIRFPLFEYWGQYSLNVMCTHYFLLRLLSETSIRFFGGYDVWHSVGFFKAILCTIVVMALQHACIRMARHLGLPNSYLFKV